MHEEPETPRSPERQALDAEYTKIMDEYYAEEQKRIAALVADPRHRVLICLRHGDTRDDHSYILATWSRDVEQGRNCDLKSYHDTQGDQVDDWGTLEDHPKERGFWIFDGEFVWEGGGGEEPEWEHRSYGAWRRPSLGEIILGLQGELGPKLPPPVDHAALTKTDPCCYTDGDELAEWDRTFEMTVEKDLRRRRGGEFRWVGKVTVTTPEQGKLRLLQTLSEHELRRRGHMMLAVADEIAIMNAMPEPIDQIRLRSG